MTDTQVTPVVEVTTTPVVTKPAEASIRTAWQHLVSVRSGKGAARACKALGEVIGFSKGLPARIVVKRMANNAELINDVSELLTKQRDELVLDLGEELRIKEITQTEFDMLVESARVAHDLAQGWLSTFDLTEYLRTAELVRAWANSGLSSSIQSKSAGGARDVLTFDGYVAKFFGKSYTLADHKRALKKGSAELLD